MTRTQQAPGSLSALLAEPELEYGTTPIEFVSQDGRYTTTMSAIRERARRLAAGLRARGVGPGDAVSMQFPLSEDAVVAQLAAVLLGAVLVPVVPVFGPREVEQVFRITRPVAHLTQGRWRKFDYLTGIAQIAPGLRPALVVAGGRSASATPDVALEWSEVESADPLEHPAHVDEDAASLIIFTSGSTGAPKGAQHTPRSMLAEALDVGYRLGVPDDELSFLYTSGAGHIAGYVYPLRILVRGMRCIVLDGWDARLAARIVDRDKPSVMAGLPFHVVSMLDAAAAEGLDLSSLRMASIGGAPVSASLVRRADAAGIPIVKSYGLTELPTAVLGDVADPVEVRAAAIGRPSGGNQVRIVDEAGDEVAQGERGEIQLRGPEMFSGYLGIPPEQTFTPDGWFPTGDIGLLDAEGRLVIIDRKKNIIIRGGENLSATEIEEIVGTHPGVVEAAVIGVPDDRYGERACAYVVLAPGASLTIPELIEHFVRQGASKQKVPEYLEFVEALPRTATGKLRKTDLPLPARL
ncbi:MAG: AMP-binding protein [Microbacterium sp.]